MLDDVLLLVSVGLCRSSAGSNKKCGLDIGGVGTLILQYLVLG